MSRLANGSGGGAKVDRNALMLLDMLVTSLWIDSEFAVINVDTFEASALRAVEMELEYAV